MFRPDDSDTMVRLGFITGLKAEARCLAAVGVADDLIVCSGGIPARAVDGAAELLARGATGLVSFGLAGGLAPSLRPGDLLLALSVVPPTGAPVATHGAWRAVLTERAAARSMRLSVVPLAASDVPVTSAAAKRALFEATGAPAVDMESHGVAWAAQAAGVPFLVLRAIADPAERGIPAPALVGLGPDGGTRPIQVAGALLRAPHHLPALLRLAADSRAGLSALRAAVRRLGPPPFGLPT